MSNRMQLRRTLTAGNVPSLAQLLTGEMALNIADKDLYVSTGSEVLHLNAAANIKTDSGNRFISDAQLSLLNNVASSTVLGHVKVGSNINVDAQGVISLAVSSSTVTGLLSSADWSTFNAKQDAIGYTPVNLAGDTMLGALTLNGAPTADNHAATKAYADQQDALAVKLAGSTMTGLLVLSADPAQNMGAATKQYVDGAVNNISGKYGAPVQALTDLAALTSASLQDKQMRLVEDTGAIFRFDVQSVVVEDALNVIAPSDVGAGAGRWIKVQGATQSHELLTGLLGGAADDHLHITTTEKNGYDGHLADTTIHLTSTQHTWLGSINRLHTTEYRW
jgi:hypothetical protein